jgi:hypothetical protein
MGGYYKSCVNSNSGHSLKVKIKCELKNFLVLNWIFAPFQGVTFVEQW